MDSKPEVGISFEESRSRVSQPGILPEDVALGYDEWAQSDKYDKDFTSQGYTGPAVIAASVAQYIPNKRDVRILDVAAGTGLVVEQLSQLGFTNVDALDPSEGMLQAAKRKNLYRNYICAFFNSSVKELKTSAYDVLVCCGAICEGHLKCDALPEMIRCVKTGGLILLVARERHVLTNKEYKDRLEPLMRQLEDEGKWTLLERTVFHGYYPGIDGIQFVFKVTK